MLNLSKTQIQTARINDNVNKSKTIDVVNTEKIKEEIEKENIETNNESNILEKVKDYYVKHSSKPTYAETARKFNLDLKDVASIARDESWFEQRIVYWNHQKSNHQQQLYDANRNIFNSLSIVSQFAIQEHAKIMLDVEKAKKAKIPIRESDYNSVYNIKDAMALVKLFNANADAMEQQLNTSDKSLEQMDDYEIEDLLSEDEKYELNSFYSFGSEEKEEINLYDEIF